MNTSLVPTGITGLDEILGGGLPPNHIYLIEGDPGSGKTTAGLQFLLEGVRRGESVLYVTMSESVAELRGIAASHGWSLEGVQVHELIPPLDELLPQGQYTVFHPGDVDSASTLKQVLEAVERSQPTRVVFDSLSEFRLMALDGTRYRRQILGIKQFFSSRNCTALLLDDALAEDDNVVLSIVHGVICLERLARDYGAKRRRIEVVKLRGHEFRDGYHDLEIRTGGLTVYPRTGAVVPSLVGDGNELKSGIEELDRLLGGGLDLGSSTLIIGPAGSGKSSIALEYAAAAAQRGDCAALYIFDESLPMLLKRARGLGQDLDRHLESGQLTAQQIDPAEISPGGFINQIRDAVLNRNLRVLVIDSLNGFLKAMPGEDFLVIQLHELLSFLSQHGVITLLVVTQHGMFGMQVDTPFDISYLADCVILLRYFEAAGRVHKAVSVVKKRAGAHEDTIRELRIGPRRVVVGEPLKSFRGILTGVPEYVGEGALLMDLGKTDERG